MQVMTADDAIDVVARRLIADLVANEVGSRWDSYPDVGEHDWERIVARARMLAEHPTEYASAYDLLTRRAYPQCTADNPPCDECRDGHA